MSTLKAGLLMALESAVNKSLSYDPSTLQRLDALAGKVLHIACVAPAQSVFVLFVDRHVELWSQFEGVPDTTLSGPASAFLHLWRGRGKPTALSDSGVTLTGDSQVLQQLQTVSAGLDIDWEALIAEHTGDLIAHRLGSAARGAMAWFGGARREAERLVSEYLQFESRALPSRHEVQQFCREVDDLQLRMDRLQARIALLQHQKNGHKKNGQQKAQAVQPPDPGSAAGDQC